MKKFVNWIMVLAGLVGAFYGIGLIVPRVQSQGSQVDLQAAPKKTMEAIANVDSWPDWHPEIASVRAQAKRNDHPIWRVTKDDGSSYDLEIAQEEEFSWQAVYELEKTRHTLRFKLSGLGEGTRVQATRSSDTRDPWQRAQTFLRMRSEVAPLAILNALAEQLGEAGNAKKH